jgi:hypothetical protein
MSKLSSGTISALQPIVDAIDAELEKDQLDRQVITIETNNPKTLKNNLAAYKTMFRRDWNSRFWMKKKEKAVEISFHPTAKLNFTMHVGNAAPEDKVIFNIVKPDAMHPGDGPVLEMNDAQVTQHMLMENPTQAQFLISNLSEATQEYLKEPKNSESTALINFLHRRGYKYQIILGTKLRVFT